MKFTVKSLGCKINQFDAGALREKLLAAGAVPAIAGETPDIYVIFTCTVTNKSDYQCRQEIRKAVRDKGEGIVVVAGCYARTNPDAVKAIPGVDIIAGAVDEADLARMILKSGAPDEDGRFRAEVMGGRSRAFLKVQDGCDARCSYCVVPFARGNSRSAGLHEVIQSADRLIARGYHEIVLTGIHLGSYKDDGLKLSGLVEKLLDRPGLGRLRLSSIEPMEFDNAMLGLIGHPKLCRHFHIPLQSGEAGVLKSMGRGYTPEQYFGVIDRIYDKVPDACIGADVIVGYPAEDEKSFRKTYSNIELSRLNHLHVFSYSPRSLARSSRMGDPVKGGEKRARSAMLRELSE
ncbi:MAG TPA: MiaB/RimO family radical SAM methylthiotransferase, partial [Nitrospirota bacterium]